MELADLVAWGMFVLLIGWIAVVLWATYVQVGSEARRASELETGEHPTTD